MESNTVAYNLKMLNDKNSWVAGDEKIVRVFDDGHFSFESDNSDFSFDYILLLSLSVVRIPSRITRVSCRYIVVSLIASSARAGRVNRWYTKFIHPSGKAILG